MALLPAICVLIVFALAGCGRGTIPPEAVIRAWGDAVATGDDVRAAKLFAEDAIVVEPVAERVLESVEDATAWNKSLRCAGRIKNITTHGDIVTATFVLGDRAEGSCAVRGGTTTTEFEVRANKIVFVRELSSTPAPAAAQPPGAGQTTAG
jgi:hypothetical protein